MNFKFVCECVIDSCIGGWVNEEVKNARGRGEGVNEGVKKCKRGGVVNEKCR